MKALIYFLFLSIALSAAMSFLFLMLKLMVVLFFYFKVGVFSFDSSDITDAVIPGCAIGMLLSLVTCFVQYLQYKKNKI